MESSKSAPDFMHSANLQCQYQPGLGHCHLESGCTSVNS